MRRCSIAIAFQFALEYATGNFR